MTRLWFICYFCTLMGGGDIDVTQPGTKNKLFQTCRPIKRTYFKPNIRQYVAHVYLTSVNTMASETVPLHFSLVRSPPANRRCGRQTTDRLSIPTDANTLIPCLTWATPLIHKGSRNNHHSTTRAKYMLSWRTLTVINW